MMAFAPVSPLTVDGLDKFLSMAYHQFINYAIFTFAELGIADRLIHAAHDRGFTTEEIIGDDRQQWNSQLLYRILRACVYSGIVKLINDDKHFILTDSGMMMTCDHPTQARDFIRFFFGPMNTSASQQLPSLVRGEGTGTGVERISGGFDFYTFLGQPDQKELLSIFSNAMTTFSVQAGAKLVDCIDFGRFMTMVDHGGSKGTLLAKILQNYPTIQHGVVFDLPHVINQVKNGEEFQSRKIHAARWSFASGDMYNSSTIPPADAYLLKYILHNHDDEKCLKILSSIRLANENRKRSPTTIFIVEHIILPDGAISNWQAHGHDMEMALIFDNARERTQDEYEELLKKSGFEFKKLYPFEAPDSVIEAVFVPQLEDTKKI
jgi:hypothetical protein